MGDSFPMAAAGSQTPNFLTPRSKVAKMLADIDDEIDNAPTPSPSKTSFEKPLHDESALHTTSASSPIPHSNIKSGTSEAMVDIERELLQSASDSDVSEDLVRPRGRLARRMLAKSKATTSSSSSPPLASAQPKQLSSPVADVPDQDDLYSATPMRRTGGARPVSRSPVRNDRNNGLFVSPAKSVDADSEEDLPGDVFGGRDKLAELVAQKRAERLAQETEEKKRKKTASTNVSSSDLPDEAFEGTQEPVDAHVDLIMSDATRPSRKASKKALLEMERETQRLARQQALAHQMKVKKKFTTNDLFAKFNFKQPNALSDQPNEQAAGTESFASSSVPNSDGPEVRTKEPVSTPPSSPPTPLDRQKELVEQGALSKLMPVRQDSIASLAPVDDDEELPEIAEVLKLDQMAKATQALQEEGPNNNKRGLKLARLGKKAAQRYDDSDDELDIVPSLPSHLRAFEKVTVFSGSGRLSDSKAIHNLKHLSNLHADEGIHKKKGSKASVSASTLENQLRKQAKDQARKQQLERIEELKAKGVDVQTSEEREKEAEAFESLLEKARQDAVELRKAERAARKSVGDDVMKQASDDEDEDEDEDYDDSGSEHEELQGEGNGGKRADSGLLDEDAEEATDDEYEEENVEDSDGEPDQDDKADKVAESRDEDENNALKEWESEGEDTHTTTRATRKSKPLRVVMDEDDEIDSEAEDVQPEEEAEPEEDPFAAFNFGAAGKANLLLSPTQAFHATMETPTQATQEDSFDMLRYIAPTSASSLAPSLSDLDTQTEAETQLSFVAGSQVPESQRISLHWETQPPETPAPANLSRGASALSETPGWEPTQDPGLPSPWSVGLRRQSALDADDQQETQSTVRMRISESPAPSQTAPRRARFVRRQAPASDDSEVDEAVPAASVRAGKKNAFREMARGRKEALTAAERAEADKEMRGMMDDQAEESEDEYAGLGGDDFVAPETEEDKEMIDSSHVEVDERALAAHFAERERSRNEAETSKLYKDLTTGVLRRKMGANAFDLEEDEDELAARRRQMRQQEEAKKRKALLKDVNIATLADGKQSKGKDAFLKAIADDDGDEDIANVSDGEEASIPATQDDSQASQSEQHRQLPLQETSGNKRALAEEDDEVRDRPPAKQRRVQTSAFKRPTSLLEVKESVSFLLDEPHVGPASGLASFELSSDSEHDENEAEPLDESEDDDLEALEEARHNDGGFAPNPASMDAKIMPPPRLPASQRRVASKPAVVDRLSLKRGSSAFENVHGRVAWAAGPTTGGFKVPFLLRRATTSVASGANDRGVTTPSLSREHSGVKMGGTKKSSLAYQARAEERRAIVEASAAKREENTARIAQLRRNSSALNKGLTGRFE